MSINKVHQFDNSARIYYAIKPIKIKTPKMFNFCQQVHITHQHHYHLPQQAQHVTQSNKSIKSRKSTRGLSCVSAESHNKNKVQSRRLKLTCSKEMSKRSSSQSEAVRIGSEAGSFKIYEGYSLSKQSSPLHNKLALINPLLELEQVSVSNLGKCNVGKGLMQQNHTPLQEGHTCTKGLFTKRSAQTNKVNLRLQHLTKINNYVDNPEVTMTPLRANYISNKRHRFHHKNCQSILRNSEVNNRAQKSNNNMTYFKKTHTPQFRKNILNDAKSIISNNPQGQISASKMVVEQSMVMLHEVPKFSMIGKCSQTTLWNMYISNGRCSPYPLVTVKKYHEQWYAFQEYGIYQQLKLLPTQGNILHYYHYVMENGTIMAMGQPYTSTTIYKPTIHQDLTNALTQLMKKGFYLRPSCQIQAHDIVACCQVNKFHTLGKLTNIPVYPYQPSSITTLFLSSMPQ